MLNPTGPKEKIAAVKNISVLYVEDDKDIRQQIADFLCVRVGVLYTAFNGKVGLELYNKYRPDVVITDIKMPVMGGLELAKAIKKIEPDVPVIVTTGFNDQEYFLRAIDLGIDKYVLKPTDPEVLFNTLIKSAMTFIKKREIEVKNKYIRFIIDTNPNFMAITDKRAVEYINKTFLEFLGFSSLREFENSNKSLTDFFLNVEGIPYSRQEKYYWLQHMINDSSGDVLVTFGANKPFTAKTKTFLLTCNKFPEIDRYVFSFTDITRIKQEKDALKKQAATDALTGVYNRNKLMEVFSSEMHRTKRYNTPLSLIMFDIDRFKGINDTYGHNVGDYVLQKVTKIISRGIRETDVLARWGGDEFLILTPEIDITASRQMAKKLSLAIRKAVFDGVGKLSSSFGVTQYIANDDMASFIKRVDDALYKAKKNGRGKVESL